MTENPFNNPTFSMMYKDALCSLYAGNVMPFERDILAMAPLPTDVVDPFASQDVDPRQIMGFAYNSLVTWIDEAKKANYFSKRFTDLSKLVMKGVMTMGRGLVTLHNRGEDLAQAPMQIGDLISVSSYHFRKSYLGVIQTAKSHPEISERLLMNQLSWTNLLLRLYKTRDKLASVVSRQQSVGNAECGIRNAESLPNAEGGMRNAELSSDNQQASLKHGHALSDVAALFEPAAIGAPRALSSLDGSKSPAVSRRNALSASRSGNQAELSGKDSAEEVGDGFPRQMPSRRSSCPEYKSGEARSDRDRCPEVSQEERSSLRCERTVPRHDKRDAKPSPSSPEETPGSFPGRGPSPDISDEGFGEVSDGTELIHETGQPEDDPTGLSPGCVDGPFYLEVLRHAFARSADNEDGKVIFTADEICYLAHDPDFAEIYPAQAADMRKILARIGQGDGSAEAYAEGAAKDPAL